VRSIEQTLASSNLRCARSLSILASLSSLGCLASGCSAALRSWMRWRSVASLVCLAADCTAALRTRRLSNLACLTSVCSDLRSSPDLFGADAERILKSFSTCAKSYQFVQLKFSVYGLM